MARRFHRRLALAAVLPLLVLGLSVPSRTADAGPRPADVLDAGETRLALERLRVTGSVLYVAAHPDDENTALLAWLARGLKVRTAYLSMTRGDGGQNLIGPELGSELGVIRTQELLAARTVDGAEQLFTRAVDFGYSKSPAETFEFWGHDSILADVVRAIRHWQPDVVITRFPTDGSGGHGHHTASAILAEEAFAAAADPARFPQCGAPWRVRRLYWNAFVRGSTRVDSSWLRVDAGGFEPLLGRSWGEIAAVSRSNHKSQGFGVAERHGALPNYLAPRLGDAAVADPLAGVDLTWRAFGPAGVRADSLLALAAGEFDPSRPEALLPRLFEVRRALASAPPVRPALLAARRAELEALIRSCSGLWAEAIALEPAVTPGDSVRVVVSIVNRRGLDLSVRRLTCGGASGRAAGVGTDYAETLTVAVPASALPTQPYWLRREPVRGRFVVDDPADIGRPEDAPALAASLELATSAGEFRFDLPVAYRWADPVQGERWRALEIAPPATLNLDHAVYLFPDRAPRPIGVRVRAQRDGVAGRVSLTLPAGWTCSPPTADVALRGSGDETHVRFTVTPGAGPEAADLSAVLTVGGRRWSHQEVRIDHPHIPPTSLYPPATARLVRADIRHAGARVGYVAGSGDAIPDALSQLGYEVVPLSDDDLEGGDLSRFDAIVTGVRAYNTRPRLGAAQPRLLDWVAAGGTLVVQYNTTADGLPPALGPYPFTISRDRVTDETAGVRVLAASHPLLTRPNAIGPADFAGWVQERGLYFANPADPRYERVLSCHDPGEPDREGGLLYARHGRGVFVYCAYAMFRQLPAGVPGAWRLFANLVSARP
ncbi:MAG: PIG-L family deacetylase [Candidatus Eisenbacteria bacterium]|nr:PIG-L family deacetylase [Candidatus Eisenbacteria bacterium]